MQMGLTGQHWSWLTLATRSLTIFLIHLPFPFISFFLLPFPSLHLLLISKKWYARFLHCFILLYIPLTLYSYSLKEFLWSYILQKHWNAQVWHADTKPFKEVFNCKLYRISNTYLPLMPIHTKIFCLFV